MGGEPAFDPWVSVGVLASTAVLAFILAVYLFNWDRHNATRRGNPLLGLLVLLPAIIGIFIA
jgi:hypothetical protein